MTPHTFSSRKGESFRSRAKMGRCARQQPVLMSKFCEENTGNEPVRILGSDFKPGPSPEAPAPAQPGQDLQELKPPPRPEELVPQPEAAIQSSISAQFHQNVSAERAPVGQVRAEPGLGDPLVPLVGGPPRGQELVV